MTDNEKLRAYKYLAYKIINDVSERDPLSKSLDYVLDHTEEFSNMTIIESFLTVQEALEKQKKIFDLEAALAILKS